MKTRTDGPNMSHQLGGASGGVVMEGKISLEGLFAAAYCRWSVQRGILMDTSRQ